MAKDCIYEEALHAHVADKMDPCAAMAGLVAISHHPPSQNPLFLTQSAGENMYPKVKVRIQREEADQYAYEKSSLESLKAFEWLSLHHLSSPDESPEPVVRVRRPYAPKSPTPSYLTSKEKTSKTKATVEENPMNVRPHSAPRPRAVLSSPENDNIIGSKTEARRRLLSGLKTRNTCQNSHVQCKIFPKSAAVESFPATQGHNKELAEPKKDIQTKARTALADSRIKQGLRRKMTASLGQP